jgi:hypothetical protein
VLKETMGGVSNRVLRCGGRVRARAGDENRASNGMRLRIGWE